MNYCVWTFSGEGLSIAERLQREGNTVIVGMIHNYKDMIIDKSKGHSKNEEPEDPKIKRRRLSMYDGILKVHNANILVKYFQDLPEEKRGEWFLFFDFNHCFKFSEQLQGLGYKGNFPTSLDRKFEENREFAKNFVRQHYPDIIVAEEQEFKTIDEGITFLEETDSLWVLKGNADDAPTKVPSQEDPEAAKQILINALKDNKQKYESSGYILEQKIPDIVEVTPEIQFYDGKPLFATVDLENKQIGSGNESFMTGCAADLVFPLSLDSKLAEISFPPAVYALAKLHKGWFIWDLSILFDRKTGKPYMGEFCPNRPGYNAIMTELALLDTVTEFFESIVEGKNPFKKAVGKFASSTRMFDFAKDKSLNSRVGSRINFSDETYNDLWMMDVKKDGKEFVTSGYNYNDMYLDLAVITGYGDTIEESAKRMFEYIKGFRYEGVYNRPYFDYISKEYGSSIPNRYQFLVDKKLL